MNCGLRCAPFIYLHKPCSSSLSSSRFSKSTWAVWLSMRCQWFLDVNNPLGFSFHVSCLGIDLLSHFPCRLEIVTALHIKPPKKTLRCFNTRSFKLNMLRLATALATSPLENYSFAILPGICVDGDIMFNVRVSAATQTVKNASVAQCTAGRSNFIISCSEGVSSARHVLGCCAVWCRPLDPFLGYWTGRRLRFVVFWKRRT